jgi:two-component system, OmpR family, sensor histidine kinase KdpD
MKISSQISEPRQPDLAYLLTGHAVAMLLVAAATIVGQIVASRWGTDPVVLLYIPPVLLVATYWGLWPSLAAAVAATLAYNFYFTVPIHTFQIQSPVDVATVIILFIVALVTSRLAGQLREQAQLAASHAARNATIAGFARRLLSCTREKDIGNVVVEELSRLFGCNAVLLVGEDVPTVVASTLGEIQLAPSDLAAASVTLTTGEAVGRGVRRLDPVDWQFRPVTSDQTILAAVGLAREDGKPPISGQQLQLLENLLDQAALAMERAQLDREAREVAKLRERDALRTSLLASIGEDFKPSLNAIGAAVRALKRGGEGDRAVIATVASETAKLDRYVDNLVDITPDSDRNPLQLGDVIIDLYRRSVQKNGQDVHLTPKEYAVFAELAKHAGRVLTHAHLLRAVWGPAYENQIDYLRVAIRALRQKLEDHPSQPSLIVNEPAVGYRLSV